MTFNNIILSSALKASRGLEETAYSLRQKNFKISRVPENTDAKIYLRRFSGSDSALFIGADETESTVCGELNIAFGLALWQHDAPLRQYVKADYYFRQPYDILNLLTRIEDPYVNKKWLTAAMEMQFIAQAGLAYSKDVFDRERFSRLSEMAAEIMSEYTALPKEKVQDLFCSETGFQTPKLDTRSAIFKDNKILLVRELDGRWSLPGGWVDVNQSICGNLKKEASEEAGLDVVPARLVAIHDRNRHNTPLFAYGIIKIFMICEIIGGHFSSNIETSESRYFALDELPPLSVGKNTKEQIELCFAAAKNPDWIPVID